MNLPIALITGGSRGLGEALTHELSKSYRVVTVSRTHGDFIGDLRDLNFRNMIIEQVTPQVLINNAAEYPRDDQDFQTLEVNLLAQIHFITAYLQKMNSGHIINISSLSARVGINLDQAPGHMMFVIAKKALSAFSEMSQYANTKEVKMSTIEPGFIMTEIANIKRRVELNSPDDIFARGGFFPMDPQYVCQVIRWILAQPEDVVISKIQIMNQRSRNFPKARI